MQSEHEAEKASASKRAMELQEELQQSEMRGPHERQQLEASLDGAIHTARNLGQIAAYFFQTGAANEAADFYTQAKNIFEAVLGADHEKTQQWQQDLFFLINAPAIKKITAQNAAQEAADKAAEEEESAFDWWNDNLPFDIAIQSSNHMDDDDEDVSGNWWMQNLFDMKVRDKRDDPDEEVSYMSAIFATPRGDSSIFTPRGTLNPALRAGMPMMPVQQKQDIGFTATWVQHAFEGGGDTQRVNSSEEIDSKMSEATEWLMAAFATPRENEAPPPAILPKPSATPRGTKVSQESEDKVFAAAIQAAMSTPRAKASNTVVDDRAMASATNKMFKTVTL